MRKENDRDSNFKSFKNKNVKASPLSFRISKFNKFNRNDNVKISHIYKNNENKRKSEFEIEYKNFIYFYRDKKSYIKFNCLNIKNRLFISLLL